MILAAPPAAAITYVNESSGLNPSVYGGGGSPSSALLFDGSPLVSGGSAALVSASAVAAAADSKGEVGAKAGSDEKSGSVTGSPGRTVEDPRGK